MEKNKKTNSKTSKNLGFLGDLGDNNNLRNIFSSISSQIDQKTYKGDITKSCDKYAGNTKDSFKPKNIEISFSTKCNLDDKESDTMETVDHMFNSV